MSLVNALIRATLPLAPRPVIRFFARRYVAGTTLDQAVATVRRLAGQGCCATIDVLGESVTQRAQAGAARDEYLRVLDVLPSERLEANVSLKPTQLGLAIDEGFCRDNIAAIIEKAASLGGFVRIDMEDSPTTDATLRVFRSLAARFPGRTGLVLQARLRRTLADAAALGAERANIRLCKGIYLEPRPIAYEERDIIRNAFVSALRVLLRAGSYVGIATHDEWLVEQALAIIADLGLRPDQYEFQMLLGVDPQLRRIIVDGGHTLRVYVPFGTHWYPYSVRRLRENPTIVRAGLEGFLRGRLDR
ncbi:MAG TPA: proline dehydrogenase family protein [Thermoanaerobaculaceae bacterium]|nr:proline dehydrogenase family protein [Thermoanaerobaculaceae bacterium]HPS78566.1 proline dehydrogenase family protein [Thermoanaerobaculaceae bacterium]